MSESVDLMQQPVFSLELGLKADNNKGPFSVDLLNKVITSYLTPGEKADHLGENRWEPAVETVAMGFPNVLIDIRDIPVSPSLLGPTVFVNIPWGCCADDVKYVTEFVNNVAERLECSVFYNHLEIIHPLQRIFPLYKKQGKILAQELKTILDRACIITSILKPLSMLELSLRTGNCLRSMGTKVIAEVVTYTETGMLKTQNFGRKSLNELKVILTDEKLKFGMEIDLLGFRHAVSHVIPKQVSLDLDFRSGMCDDYLQNFIRVLSDYISPAFELDRDEAKNESSSKLGRVQMPESTSPVSCSTISPADLMRKTRSDALQILDS